MLEPLDYLVDEIISLNSKLVLLEDPPGRDKTAHRAEPANLRGMNFNRDGSKSAIKLQSTYSLRSSRPPGSA